MISRLHTRHRKILFYNVMELALLTTRHNLCLVDVFICKNRTIEMMKKSNFLSLIRIKNDFDKQHTHACQHTD